MSSMEVSVQTSHHEGLLGNPGLHSTQEPLKAFEKLYLSCVIKKERKKKNQENYTSHALQHKLMIIGNSSQEPALPVQLLTAWCRG